MKEWREAEAEEKKERRQALLGRKEQVDKELERLELDLMLDRLTDITALLQSLTCRPLLRSTGVESLPFSISLITLA
jgi:hypothetical protein